MAGCATFLFLVLSIAAFAIAMIAKQQAERSARELRGLQMLVEDLQRQVARLREGSRESGWAETPLPQPEAASAQPVMPAASEEVAVPFVVDSAPSAPILEPVAPVVNVEPPVAPAIEPAPEPQVWPAAALNNEPPPPPRPHAAPAAAARSFDWESLVGVKLFSWIAGVALALAAVFFLKYSVDHGWLTPSLRVAIGLATGLGVIAICEMRIARNYRFTANAMHGAGIAILYATLFASHSVWHLIPQAAVFAGMIVVTALAVFLSLRRDSVFIAILGLLGGFATPALLSSGENRPIALFGYLLLLNLGIAWVAFRKRWPVLSVASAIFTVLYQWGWVSKYLTDAQMPLAAAIFGVFAIVGGAAIWTRRTGDEIDPTQTIFERIGLATSVVPLFFAAFAAAVPAYGSRFHVLFAFLLLINIGLAVIAVLRRHAWLNTLGGAGALLTFALWLAFSYASDAWPVLFAWLAGFVVLHLIAGKWLPASNGIAAMLLFVFPALAALEPASEDAMMFLVPLFVMFTVVAWIATQRRQLGAFIATSIIATVAPVTWVVLRGSEFNVTALLVITCSLAIVQLACVLRIRAREGAAPFADASVFSLGLYLVLVYVAVAGHLADLPWAALAALALLNLAIGIASILLRRSGAAIGAAILSQVIVSAWAVEHGEVMPAVGFGAALVIAFASIGWFQLARREQNESTALLVPLSAIFGGMLTCLVASHNSLLPARFDETAATFSLLLVAALALAYLSRRLTLTTAAAISAVLITLWARDLQPAETLILTGTFAALFTLFPLIGARRVGRSIHPYVAAVVAHGLFLMAGNSALEQLGATRLIGLFPTAQAAILLGLLWHLMRREPVQERVVSRLAFLAAAVLAFLTVAIPLQFENEWLTLGWVLEAAALVWLYRRIEHVGLLRWAGALYAIVFARLVLNSAIFEYHPRTGTPLFNWYLYAYVVASAAFFIGGQLLPRSMKRSIAALASGGTFLLFVLVNIEIADFYSTGNTLAFNFFSASLAEDLSYTVAWALFAIGVLVAGIVVRSRGARIAALVLLAGTILKCFLHDLSRLGGLYRVGSLLGLAISLVVVGLLIQRFVISREDREAADVA